MKEKQQILSELRKLQNKQIGLLINYTLTLSNKDILKYYKLYRKELYKRGVFK